MAAKSASVIISLILLSQISALQTT